jgi:replicative DNA helicase
MAISDDPVSTPLVNVEANGSMLGAILFDNFAYNQATEHVRGKDFLVQSMAA